MDSVTQIALGAAIGVARTANWKPALWCTVAGTLYLGMTAESDGDTPGRHECPLCG